MYDAVVKSGLIVDGSGGPAFTADIAVQDGCIAAVGRITEPASEVIDADGALVAPGWIDIHTHYDGQAAWDESLEGSAANGVTTVVTGNCGVGFAPVRVDGAAALMDLMEGVEDIPGSALSEGIPWGEWESFPEYLDFLGRRRWTMDVGTQVPHGALRFYVMGQRAIENLDATEDDLRQMASLTEQAVREGALGFSSSRIQRHLSVSGRPIPGTYAPESELRALAAAARAGGGRVLQAVPSNAADDAPGLPPEYSTMLHEIAMFARISRETGLRVTLTTAQLNSSPDAWRDALRATAVENANGAFLHPQVAARPATMLSLLEGYHLFARRPTFLRLAQLPHQELVRRLSRPEVKDAILREDDAVEGPAGLLKNRMPLMLQERLAQTFPVRVPIDYEPTAEQSIAGQASAQRRDPSEVMYDLLLEDGGRGAGMGPARELHSRKPGHLSGAADGSPHGPGSR